MAGDFSEDAAWRPGLKGKTPLQPVGSQGWARTKGLWTGLGQFGESRGQNQVGGWQGRGAEC